MPATEKRGFFRCFWQQLKKLPETFLVPTKVWWKLPENRASFSSSARTPEAKKFANGTSTSRNFFHVGDETRAFDAKEKIFRRFLIPAPLARRSLQRIKRSVDLNWN